MAPMKQSTPPIAFAILFFLMAGTVLADPLVPLTGTYTGPTSNPIATNYDPGTIDTSPFVPWSYNLSGFAYGPQGTYVASATGGANPSLYLQQTIDPTCRDYVQDCGGELQETLDYGFEIVNPLNPNDTSAVNVLMNANSIVLNQNPNAALRNGSYGGADAVIEILQGNSPTIGYDPIATSSVTGNGYDYWTDCGGQPCVIGTPYGTVPSPIVPTMVTLDADTPYILYMQLLVQPGAYGGNYASADLDPQIILSPNPVYTLDFGAGVTPAVTPEPSMLGLLFAELGAVAFLFAGLRLRRRAC